MWESKPYLKILKKLGDLCKKNDYDWDVDVPDMKKSKFIRETIKPCFENLKIQQIITNGYHSSLRNAFAHSEYIFSLNEPKFQLLNYKDKDKSWALSEISFDDWTERFCYTFLLGYNIQKKIHTEKQSLISGNSFRIKHRNRNGDIIDSDIVYDRKKNAFSFKKKGL